MNELEIIELQKKIGELEAQNEELTKDIETIMDQFGLFFSVFGGGKAGNALAAASKMLMWEPEKFAEMGATMHTMLSKYNIKPNAGNEQSAQPKRKGFFGKFA